jgi:hypothetical protein
MFMRATTKMLLAAALLGAAATSASATPASLGLSAARAKAPAPAPAGIAQIRCVLGQEGALTGCTLVSEAPLGMGVGDAALKMSQAVKLPGGQAGQVVTIPFKIMLAPAAPTGETAAAPGAPTL